MKFSLAMQSTINTLHYLSRTNKKDYCYPSQEKVLKILKEIYRVAIRRRQLNYILKYLEEEGYIKRRRRLKQSKEGKIIFNTTLYWLKKKALKYLANLLGAIKRTGFKLIDKKKENQKKEVPPGEDERYLISEEQRFKNLTRLRHLLNQI
jgi:hypothetical protein